MYPKKIKTLIQKDTCNPMFMAALFTIAKTELNKVPINRQMEKDMLYTYIVYTIYSGILLSHKRVTFCHL